MKSLYWVSAWIGIAAAVIGVALGVTDHNWGQVVWATGCLLWIVNCMNAWASEARLRADRNWYREMDRAEGWGGLG